MSSIVPIAIEIRPVVYTKTTWAGDWIEQPLLQAIGLTIAAAPSHSQATFLWKYGDAMLQAIGSRKPDDRLKPVPRGDFLGNYVRVQFGDQIWWGVIQDVSDARGGLINNKIPSGLQTYTAFGLTWFLDNCKPIRQSVVKNSSGSWTIDRVIPFNAGTGDGRSGKSVAWKNYDSTAKCYTDRSQSTTPEPWTAAAAIGYLLNNFFPRNSAGDELVPFVLADDADSYLGYELPAVAYEGLTPWQVIVRLVDRRRGLLLTTTVVDDEIQLVVRSQNITEITLPSGTTIPANPDTRSYNFDSAYNVKQPTVDTTLITKVDQVRCFGERAGSVFTVRPGSNFEADWTTAQKTTYDQGASVLGSYSILSADDKAAANADRRAADDVERVYSWWRASNTWNGRSDTDPTSGSAPFAFPKIDADGEADTATGANVMRGGLRIADKLPLRAGVDYTSAAITPDTDGTDDIDADFLPPILLLKASAIRASGDAGWVHGERLNAAVDSGSEKRLYEFSVDLSVREDNPGLILKTQGAPQHYLCRDLFTPIDTGDSVPSDKSLTSANWLATVYMQQDQYCRAQYPLEADLPERDLIRTLDLQIPHAYLDYVVPGTVLGVKGGELQKSSAGGFVRDDRERLHDIARMAFEWHGQTRRVLRLGIRGIVSGFSVGHLITTIGRGQTVETINTAITSVAYDFTGGTMQIQTQFGELDFTV